MIFSLVPSDAMLFAELNGLFVGGCVERGVGSSFRAQAHAHTENGPFYGWVCVRSYRRIFTPSGRLSQLMLHEIAHVIVRQGHTDKWRECARCIGYRLPERYRKKQRV